MSNLALRVLTALVGIPLIVGAVYVGGWPLALLVAAGALAAQYELYGMLEAGGARPYRVVGLALGALLVLRPLVPGAVGIAAVGLLALIAASPFMRREGQPLTDLGATLFGVVYPAAFLGTLLDLRLARGLELLDEQAFWLTIAVFVLIWATDSFAYFVGRAIGKRPLAPRVSPKKTWEGSIGGALSAVGIAALLKLSVLAFLPWLHVVVVALLCGIVSQFGDLAESHMKRAVGVKDSGNLLPGHGGLLDRLDAMILSVPLVYLYLAAAM